jgi:signal transduction histidine kinase
MLQVPFIHREMVLGVAMVVTLDELRYFRQEQIDLAWGLASAVAPAIENARLYQRVEELAVLEERARLAREIHDDVAQVLGALQLRVWLLDNLLSDDKVGEARDSLPEVQDLVSKAYSELRESVFDLRAMAAPPVAFLPELQEYLTDYRQHYELEVSLEADVDAATMLDGSAGVQVIRIIQEALTNARRHAQAGHAWVRIERLGERVSVSVEDDGQGFDPSGAFSADQPHFGLQVMRERAEKVCGRLAVNSRPGAGTRVELCLPGSPNGGQP